MPTIQHYPALRTLINFDKLPEFLKSSLSGVANKIFYKSYYVEKSLYGDVAYHHIIIVLNNEVGLNFFGGEDGFELLFNPGSVAGTTEIPFTIYYNLPIVKYVRQVRLEDLNSVRDYFDLILRMFNISKQQVFFEVLEVFFGEYELPIIELVNNFNQNSAYNNIPQLVVPSTGAYHTDVRDLINQLSVRNIDVLDYTIDNFIDISNLSLGFEGLSSLFKRWLGEITFNSFIDLFIPKFSVSLQQLELALAFPRTWLKPVDANGNVIEDENIKSMLSYNVGSLTYHSEKGIDFNNPDSFDLTPSQIGNTGLLIDIDTLKFDLRTDKNIPEATADGRGNEFRGVYAEYVGITLPKKWFNNVDNTTLRVAGYNMLIGNGGISGTVALEAVNQTPIANDDYLDVEIGNWKLGLKAFDLTFRQNSIIESNIEGRMLIPKLKDASGNDALIEIKGHLNDQGDFLLTASEQDGIAVNIPNVMEILIKTVELGKEGDDFFIGTSCDLKFDEEDTIIGKFLGDQVIPIERLRIWSDGSIEILGGAIAVPTNFKINLGPVEVAITGINFGSYQQEHNGVMRRYNYFGFDGAISVDPLGIDARGEGIKYYYTVDGEEPFHSYIRIQTIEVDLIIPGSASEASATAIINGWLSIDKDEYAGGVSLKLPKVGISGRGRNAFAS